MSVVNVAVAVKVNVNVNDHVNVKVTVITVNDCKRHYPQRRGSFRRSKITFPARTTTRACSTAAW